jgi:hypothetical protein
MIKVCCQEADNLITEETGKSDLSMKRCQICKCRHFELVVDAGKFGIELQQVG